MAKKNKSNWDILEPQKSSAAQYLTYIASCGITDENIWMSQKMLASVYKDGLPITVRASTSMSKCGAIDLQKVCA